MRRNFNSRRSQLTGLAVVEFAIVLPVLMIILFGVVDFGRTVLVRQVMINLSREAANLASRGTPLDDAMNAIIQSAAPLDMNEHGRMILSEVVRDVNGNTTISDQRIAGSLGNGSRVGTGVGNPATLPATDTPIPLPGQNMFVAEVYYQSPPITPLGNLVNITLGEIFYDAAFF